MGFFNFVIYRMREGTLGHSLEPTNNENGESHHLLTLCIEYVLSPWGLIE